MPTEGRKWRILVIDDEISFLRMLQLNLERTGEYEICLEANGLKAIETARAFSPDLILLDVVMPDIDGEEVAKQIRAEPALAHVPIIFLTATISRGDADQRNRGLGPYVVLAKPIALDEILPCIKRNLPSSPRS
jgi:CheY-like chemotaxis protein